VKIGWLIRVGGIFGSTRESIEIGNAFMRRGHSFTMYTDEARDLGWLPNTLSWKVTEDAAKDDLDCLFWSDTPDDRYYNAFQASKAKVKSFCMMGMDPALAKESIGSGRLGSIIRENWIIADGAWQLPYISMFTDNFGPSMGGVNLKQFRPVDVPQAVDVVWSGDSRERKGGITVIAAIKGLNADSYFRKRVPQDQLSAFICKAPIFVDGHKRGGHCNPVLEAMACGRAVVCTDTPCNSDFAEHGYNCLKVPVGDHKAMRAAIEQLMAYPAVAAQLMENALSTAQDYDYDKVVIPLEEAIKSRL